MEEEEGEELSLCAIAILLHSLALCCYIDVCSRFPLSTVPNITDVLLPHTVYTKNLENK